MYKLAFFVGLFCVFGHSIMPGAEAIMAPPSPVSGLLGAFVQCIDRGLEAACSPVGTIINSSDGTKCQVLNSYNTFVFLSCIQEALFSQPLTIVSDEECALLNGAAQENSPLPANELNRKKRATQLQQEPTASGTKIGINGFGRIGRLVLRAAIERGDSVVAVNDPFIDVNYMAYILQSDFDQENILGTVSTKDGFLIVNDQQIKVLNKMNPNKNDWAATGAEYIVTITEVPKINIG
ncbi:glyceraldehyde-3-phosphate dehydrogenase GAPCP1, chloroplastic-like [Scaptodrosophila lebanonensis]|uniref:Glyceraldehyde-3-phosphate dehydrogenase GAPCP1, chloroplastic-like n=1 Tax=Drosophila lebanonensis TaxID=7225 RepID=A0A6J2UCW7_DROLE|nr:glyceraldehyde-3-phosphate dehydrogenase GAPCP1, chloroplastic-like [Scaptodrosophila lebanonensis]